MPGSIAPLRHFVGELTRLLDARTGEAALVAQGGAALRALVASDGWLPDEFAEPNPDSYRQYLLYCDPWERFSVVSFVWGPGQCTPIHDHTVWGLIGMLRGAELSRDYRLDPAGVWSPAPCRGWSRAM
jgi:predicted metal-dependent enzyme (double-stranded beta helix superfamily)